MGKDRDLLLAQSPQENTETLQINETESEANNKDNLAHWEELQSMKDSQGQLG